MPSEQAWIIVLTVSLLQLGCGAKPDGDDSVAGDDDAVSDDDGADLANVEGVSATGDPGDYTFGVTLRSPDVDCDQYANWWEVLSVDGQLIYRRILTHSHADEQPFTRTGGPVPVQPADTVIVRGHLNTTGYGGTAMRGSVEGGFAVATDIDASFAPEVEQQEPQPEECLW